MTLQDAEAAYGQDDFETAFRLYRSLADQGAPQALYRLGYMYSNGEGVEVDHEAAINYFRAAAQADHPVAAYCLGACYAMGQGVEQDFEQARHWYQRSAESGDADAMFKLGMLHARGEGGSQDFDQARQWWLQAAEANQPQALQALGQLYERGLGVDTNVLEAATWYHRSVLAGGKEAGGPFSRILPQLKELAEQGSTPAKYFYGWYLYHARKQPQEAAPWLEQAAQAGHAQAARLAGYLYINGEGVESNEAKAASYYRIGAEGGDAFAQHNLATCYDDGWGVPVDLDQAIHWYRQAAAQGFQHSWQPLAELLARRSRSRADACEAVQWTVKLAQQAPGETFLLRGGDKQCLWVAKIANGGNTVNLSGITQDQLTLDDQPLTLGPVDPAMLAEVEPTADALLDAAMECRLEGDLDEALQLLNRAIALEPDKAWLWFERGEVLAAMRRTGEAITNLDQAIALGLESDSLPDAYTSRGWCHEQAGHYREALADYATALALDPQHCLALNNMAWIRATCPVDELRDGRAAVHYALAACEQTDWEEANFLDTLAAAQAELGNFAEAIRLVQEAIACEGEDASALLEHMQSFEQHRPLRSGSRKS